MPKITVLAKESYNFTSLATGTPAPIQEFIIIKTLDLRAYRSAALLVRIHTAWIAQAGAMIQVAARATNPSPEDPSTDYLPLSNVADLAAVTITSTTSYPVLEPADMGAHFGSFVRIVIRGQQAGTVGNLSATISVDVVGKE